MEDYDFLATIKLDIKNKNFNVKAFTINIL